MNILVIDTTTNNLLVAIKKGEVVYKNKPQTTSKHLEVALPQVDYVINGIPNDAWFQIAAIIDRHKKNKKAIERYGIYETSNIR